MIAEYKKSKLTRTLRTIWFNKFIKKITILCLCLLIFNLSFINTNSQSLDYDENGIDDLRETGWFIYPLLPQFYAVADWEVAACLHYSGGEQLEPKNIASALGASMQKAYPGQINSISASMTKDYPDPDDPYKLTNMYQVCWAVLPVGETSMKFSVYLNDGKNLKYEVAKDKSAQPYVGNGGCEIIYSKDKYTKAYIIIPGPILLPPANVMDIVDKKEVT
ncbi:MAG: hypothetical protein ABIG89_07215 [Candidatus Woesearchaeota archaeon]